MTIKICIRCGRSELIAARGFCSSCYQIQSKKLRQGKIKADEIYPLRSRRIEMEKCTFCGKLIKGEAYSEIGLGLFCSQECLEDFKKLKSPENKKGIKDKFLSLIKRNNA